MTLSQKEKNKGNEPLSFQKNKNWRASEKEKGERVKKYGAHLNFPSKLLNEDNKERWWPVFSFYSVTLYESFNLS